MHKTFLRTSTALVASFLIAINLMSTHVQAMTPEEEPVKGKRHSKNKPGMQDGKMPMHPTKNRRCTEEERHNLYDPVSPEQVEELHRNMDKAWDKAVKGTKFEDRRPIEQRKAEDAATDAAIDKAWAEASKGRNLENRSQKPQPTQNVSPGKHKHCILL